MKGILYAVKTLTDILQRRCTPMLFECAIFIHNTGFCITNFSLQTPSHFQITSHQSSTKSLGNFHQSIQDPHLFAAR